jgi:hypothetical protein
MTRRIPGLVPGLVVGLALLVTACVTPEGSTHRQPEAVDDGVQVTGVLGGSRIAIASGAPEVSFRDCDGGDGLDDDVCWVARSIDGLTLAFVIENPAVLVAGEAIPVRDDPCDHCDDVTDKVVVDIRVNGEQRRATGGTMTVIEIAERIAARFRLTFPGGDDLTGTFNVRELRPGEE